jgi:hypothetical protein
MSLPVTRSGFTVMTLKPNNNPHTGIVLLRLTPRSTTSALAKAMVLAFVLFFFDHRGIVHYEFASEGQKFN